ncbi:MAG: energy-coupling factor ABC transporter ATP-binding protein, partial [Bryobacteraceae bacterium]|nr:energy-coupling factor ABC transporter ATP-binding protein [Bryobacteraceae bacterium]
MDTLIRVDDLRFHYDDGTAALRGINFHLEAGERVVLFGGNGSGKTTFALHLNGLLRGEGRIEICGLRLEDANLAAIRSKIGMVFQDPEDQLFMPTVLEDVCFGVINQGRAEEEARQIALAALEQVGMKAAAGKAPYHLSSG